MRAPSTQHSWFSSSTVTDRSCTSSLLTEVSGASVMHRITCDTVVASVNHPTTSRYNDELRHSRADLTWRPIVRLPIQLDCDPLSSFAPYWLGDIYHVAADRRKVPAVRQIIASSSGSFVHRQDDESQE